MEDEALVAMLVEDALAGAGYGPVWSPDGRRPGRADPAAAPGAAAEAAAAVVGLRLADGLDGRDVIRALRRACPALPVVVVTGFHPEAPQADLRGLGGPTLRLTKPFDCEELVAGLSAVLAGSEGTAAPRRRRSDRAAATA